MRNVSNTTYFIIQTMKHIDADGNSFSRNFKSLKQKIKQANHLQFNNQAPPKENKIIKYISHKHKRNRYLQWVNT